MWKIRLIKYVISVILSAPLALLCYNGLEYILLYYKIIDCSIDKETDPIIYIFKLISYIFIVAFAVSIYDLGEYIKKEFNRNYNL